MSEFDLLIVGSGISGLSAALSAKEEKANILVVTKGTPTKNNSVMAQGGINAALGNVEPDSIKEHIKDTIKSAHSLANREMVELLCNEAINAIEFLEQIGVPFSRVDGANSPLKSIAQRKLGGASFKRACYAQDYTGLKILHTLLDSVINNDIKIREGLFLLELIKNRQDEVCGALFFNFNSGKIEPIYAKRVLLATGGFGAIYAKNTNSYGSSGDGIAAVLRAGGVVSNMEFVQFHPTSLKGSNILISESARGEGGYLINSDGKRFIDELASRDIVASAVFKQIQSSKKVFLDLRHIGKEKLYKLMPQELKIIKTYTNLDATNELIEIESAVHYTMGGIDINSNFEVNGLNSCFSVGECSNAKVHGANRLGGNSLLEAVAFGRVGAKKALSCSAAKIEKENFNYILPIKEDKSKDIFRAKRALGEILNSKVGVIRDNENLLSALDKIKSLDINSLSVNGELKYNSNLIELLELKNSYTLAVALIKSALWRKESRGAHIRSDYLGEREEFEKNSFFSF